MAEGQRFLTDKARVLDKADLSRKGSVDENIKSLVEFINAQPVYYTTSSCSGRVVVFAEENKKKGCKWLLVSHDPVNQSELIGCLSKDSQSDHESMSYTILKFEAFILHVVCRSFTDAQVMLQVALRTGFRNSGISCGKKGRMIVAVRSTLGLEVPVAHINQLLVSHEYLGHLADLVGTKMKENRERTDSFHASLREAMEEKQDSPAKVSRERQNYRDIRQVLKSKTDGAAETDDDEDLELGDLFSDTEPSL